MADALLVPLLVRYALTAEGVPHDSRTAVVAACLLSQGAQHPTPAALVAALTAAAGPAAAASAAAWLSAALQSCASVDTLMERVGELRALLVPPSRGASQQADVVPPAVAASPDDDDGSGGGGGGGAAWLLPPGLARVAPDSALGLLLRRCVVEVSSLLFDGVLALADGARVTAAGLEAAAAAANEQQLQTPPVGGDDDDDGDDSDDGKASGPLASRREYAAALARGDYPAAVAALHALFDVGYGAGLLGGSAVTGTATGVGLLAGAGSGRGGVAPQLTGSLARVRELLLVAASAPPVGGVPAPGLRSLLHYPLLRLAATELWFGHTSTAADALRECLRVAHANGDAPGAAYSLALAVEASALAAAGEGDHGGDAGRRSSATGAASAAPCFDRAAHLCALAAVKQRAGADAAGGGTAGAARRCGGSKRPRRCGWLSTRWRRWTWWGAVMMTTPGATMARRQRATPPCSGGCHWSRCFGALGQRELQEASASCASVAATAAILSRSFFRVG